MKRAWMLLLVMIALIAVMAIPALAAETHDHTADKALEAGAVTITESGTYYLTADTAVSVTVSSEIDVTICLNGKQWTNGTGVRPLTITGGATVNVVDCSAQTDGVSAGTITGVDVSANTEEADYNGGTLYIDAATVKIHNGTVTGGTAKYGGNVHIVNSGNLYLIGGVIKDGVAVINGGNLYITSGKLYMGTKGSADVESPRITGGQNTTKQNGGSIYSTGSGTMYIYSGKISGGASLNIGGNIYTNGRIEMSGGLITDGSAQNSKTTGSANIASVNGDIYVSGGQIDGCWGNTNTANGGCKIVISGSAKILGGGISFAGYADKWTAAPYLSIGELEADAVITVNGCSGFGAPSYIAYYKDTPKEELEAMIASGQLIIASGYKAVYYSDGLGVHGNSEIWHCICGANQGESHIGDCTGYDVKWTAHKLTGTNKLPVDKLGYYYLVDNDGTNDNQVNFPRSDMTNRIGLYIDFNGITATVNTGVRFGNLYSTSTTAPTVIVFTDSSQGHTGKLKTACPDKTDHSNIWLRMAEVTDKKESKSVNLNCYRLNIDCSPITKTAGAGIVVGAGNVLNLYECHLIGGVASNSVSSAITNEGGTVTVIGGSITGTSAKTNGGAIYNVNKNYQYKDPNDSSIVLFEKMYYSSMTLDGVTINGGTATNGSAIYNSSTLTVTNCTINGGTATDGAAIYSSGNLTVTNSTINGGTASTSGGAIYNGGTLTMTDCTVTGGTAGTSGSAIYTKTGTLLATNCTILGGTAGKNGGAILHLSGTATYTNCDITAHTNEDESIVAQNGAAVYVNGGTMTLTGGSTVTGGLADLGGAVYMAGGTFNLYDGTISGGTAAEGGNVYMTGTSTKFNAIPDPAGQAQGATRLIKDGHADATDAHSKGGNFCLYSGAKLTLTGATVSDGWSTTVSEVFNSNNEKEHRYSYGGNIYAVNANTEITLNGGTVVENGSAHAISHRSNTWTPGANIDLDSNSKLTVENATITGGQSLAEENNSSVDGKNLYINYGCEVILNSGAVISNTDTVNTQENLLIQGGYLEINDDARITTAEGVTGYNLYFNNSAYNNNPQHTQAPHVVMNGGTISGGNGTSGGNVVLGYLSVFDMHGGVIEDGVSGNSGGNVKMTHLSQFNMDGGIVQNGSARDSGANFYIPKLESNAEFVSAHNAAIDPDKEAEDLTAKDIAGKLTMSGDAKIIGGRNTNDTPNDKNGGSIFAGLNTSITLDGNAEIYGGTSIWCGGNIYTNGTLTVGGNAKIYGGAAKTNADACNIFVVTGTLNLKDNAIIAGGIGTGGTNPTVNISGSPTVDKSWTPEGYSPAMVSGYSLRLSGSNMANVEALSGANIYVDCGTIGAQTLRVFTNAAENLAGAEAWLPQFHCDVDGYVIGISNDYKLYLGKGEMGATINGGNTYYELGAAAEKAIAGDLITMQSAYEGDVVLKDGTWLDLNGQTLTGNITTNGLYLIDSANNAYKDNGGKVTGSIGTDPMRVFTTGSQVHYSGNHRFLVLKTADGYSAHRIYLTVKSTVLYPNKPALNYRTVFKCDDTVAANVAAYGVKAGAENYEKVVPTNYLEKGIVLNPATDNSYISQLNNILNPNMELDEQILNAETKLITYAYITINDSFGSNNEVTSASVKKSFKDMVEYADGLNLSAVQQASLRDLYNKYKELMTQESAAWNLKNIPTYESSEARGFQFRCMCNDPTSTGNPCAANGHKHFIWQPWTDFNAADPVSGNYYLASNVTLTQGVTIPAGQIVSIDLCGHSLNVDAITVADGGVLNLTNSAETNVTIAAAVTVNGNMSVYSSVSLSRAVVGSGDMNLYGGTATKAEAFTGTWYSVNEE